MKKASVTKGAAKSKRLQWTLVNGGKAKVAQVVVCGTILEIRVGRVGSEWRWEFGVFGRKGQGSAKSERHAKLCAVIALRDYINSQRHAAIDLVYAEETALVLKGALK